MRHFLYRCRVSFDRLFRRESPAGFTGAHRSASLSLEKDDSPNSPDPDTFYQAVNVTRGTIVARKILWAGTSEERRRGLLGRPELGREEGVYIVPTQWIHMFGMQFPIDIAFLAADGRVLHMHHGLKPNRLSRMVLRAEGALELAEGTLQAARTTIGDIIELQQPQDMSQ